MILSLLCDMKLVTLKIAKEVLRVKTALVPECAENFKKVLCTLFYKKVGHASSTRLS